MVKKTLHLSMEEICRIIETSSKAGVTLLKFGDLHVEFGGPVKPQEELAVHPEAITPPVAALTEDQHVKQTAAALEADEVYLKEDQLARLLVEDPVRYEELLRSGELGDDLEPSDEESE